MDFQPYNEALHNVTVAGFWACAIIGIIAVAIACIFVFDHVGDGKKARDARRRLMLLLGSGLGMLLVAVTFLGVGATFPSGRSEAFASYSQQAKERYDIDVSPDDLARTHLSGVRPGGAQFYIMPITFGGIPQLIVEDPKGVLKRQDLDAAYDGEKVLLGTLSKGVFTEFEVIE